MIERIRAALNKTSLRRQLTLLISVVLTVSIAAIVAISYASNVSVMSERAEHTGRTILKLEAAGLADYFDELERYSMLLRQNAEFMGILESTGELKNEDVMTIMRLVRNQYYSRRDLLRYRLYLIDSDTGFEMNSREIKVRTFYSASDIQRDADFARFASGGSYKYFRPAEDGFVVFYRTFINISDKRPLAVVELTLDGSYPDSLSQSHTQSAEVFAIADSDSGSIVYSNAQAADLTDASAFSGETARISGAEYIALSQGCAGQPLTLYLGLPVTALKSELSRSRNISVLIGLAVMAAGIAICAAIIRFATRPLGTLAQRLQNVGSGDFTTAADIDGSAEVVKLSESFNDMTSRINTLINDNYVSEINEKTARLIALEAQLNPHFLYNTLQAISAEALENGEPRINSMVTSLASMLRYTIKGGNTVSLKNEYSHVKDYLFLQQARFGERLNYALNIPADMMEIEVPKLCLQLLAENSITHGMMDSRPVNIEIGARTENGALLLWVKDDGAGMNPERLKNLEAQLAEPRAQSGESIGLKNLAVRLELLYGDGAGLSIQSEPYVRTTVSLCLPRTKKGRNESNV